MDRCKILVEAELVFVYWNNATHGKFTIDMGVFDTSWPSKFMPTQAEWEWNLQEWRMTEIQGVNSEGTASWPEGETNDSIGLEMAEPTSFELHEWRAGIQCYLFTYLQTWKRWSWVSEGRTFLESLQGGTGSSQHRGMIRKLCSHLNLVGEGN